MPWGDSICSASSKELQSDNYVLFKVKAIIYRHWVCTCFSAFPSPNWVIKENFVALGISNHFGYWNLEYSFLNYDNARGFLRWEKKEFIFSGPKFCFFLLFGKSHSVTWECCVFPFLSVAITEMCFSPAELQSWSHVCYHIFLWSQSCDFELSSPSATSVPLSGPWGSVSISKPCRVTGTLSCWLKPCPPSFSNSLVL